MLNLRSPDEEGFLDSEQQQTEAEWLYYINLPVNVEAINPEIAAQVLKQLDELSKPALVHCKACKACCGNSADAYCYTARSELEASI